ncbi:MAG: hypothetical protein JWM91_3013 [Rhodospirillales bacterium]|nr:hypothetical protein [Rhodospirillales bacterium]
MQIEPQAYGPLTRTGERLIQQIAEKAFAELAAQCSVERSGNRRIEEFNPSVLPADRSANVLRAAAARRKKTIEPMARVIRKVEPQTERSLRGDQISERPCSASRPDFSSGGESLPL